jgi:hypothetical protein
MNDPRLHVAALVVVLGALLVPAASAQEPPPATTPAPQAAPPTTAEAVKAEDPWYLKGRFLVGASWGSVVTIDKNLGTQYRVSPFFRWNSRRAGWGPSFGLSWTETDLRVPVDGRPVTVGHVKVRPVMGGIGYSIVRGRVRTSLGLVAGYTFNKSELTVALPEGTTASIDIDDTWALSPKADVTFAVTRRIALVGSAGYVFSNPNVSVSVAQNGQETYRSSDHVRADAFVVRVGAAVSIF